RAVASAHPRVEFDGCTSWVDTNAVDAERNIDQAVHGQPRIHVYSATGEKLATVGVPSEAAEGVDTATNVAIEPGTTDAYMTVSGQDGGFVYEFEAFGEGIRQSNGG